MWLVQLALKLELDVCEEIINVGSVSYRIALSYSWILIVNLAFGSLKIAVSGD